MNCSEYTDSDEHFVVLHVADYHGIYDYLRIWCCCLSLFSSPLLYFIFIWFCVRYASIFLLHSIHARPLNVLFISSCLHRPKIYNQSFLFTSLKLIFRFGSLFCLSNQLDSRKWHRPARIPQAFQYFHTTDMKHKFIKLEWTTNFHQNDQCEFENFIR